jgi:uncharacterized protein YbjT (DUF2867 family)
LNTQKLKILIFGSSGMVGQGVLRQCLLDNEVVEAKIIVRSKLEQDHPKLKQIVTNDLFHLETFSAELAGYDACFFSVGVTSAGKSEVQYSRFNYDLPVYVSSFLVRLNPNMVLTYVSGLGTDSSEKGPVMWARVKGKTENALMAMPFKAVYIFRLGGLIPKHGEVSRTGWYRHLYAAAKPFAPIFEKFFASYVTTTEKLGLAMLHAAKFGKEKKIVENKEIAQLV